MSDALARNDPPSPKVTASPDLPHLPSSLIAPGCERGLPHQVDRQIPSEAHDRLSRETLSDGRGNQ
jgi:hypothetical protein